MKYLVYEALAVAVTVPVLIGEVVLPLFNSASNIGVLSSIAVCVLIIMEGLSLGTKIVTEIINKTKEAVRE